MNDILVEKTGTAIKDFLAALVEPLQTRGDEFFDFETNEKKRAVWNGRKMVLQAALNDIFGITSAPFILVTWNRDISSNTFFFEPSENSPVYFSEVSEDSPIFFFEPGELATTDYDFTVEIPTGIHTAELERRVIASTKLYKLAGPNFNVITY